MFDHIAGLFDKQQMVGEQDPNSAVTNLGNYSAAITSTLRSICAGNAGCDRMAYDVIVPYKGALAEIIFTTSPQLSPHRR